VVQLKHSETNLYNSPVPLVSSTRGASTVPLRGKANSIGARPLQRNPFNGIIEPTSLPTLFPTQTDPISKRAQEIDSLISQFFTLEEINTILSSSNKVRQQNASSQLNMVNPYEPAIGFGDDAAGKHCIPALFRPI